MALIPYDDRDGWAVSEGESMRTGEIFHLGGDNRRLFGSAEILDFEIPHTLAEIDEACKKTCARKGVERPRIRYEELAAFSRCFIVGAPPAPIRASRRRGSRSTPPALQGSFR